MIKIGILGCAEIAFRRFLPALMENKEFECVCIAEEYDKSKLEQFEKEVGYPFRPEYIIDQGYYNNQYRVPSKEFKDFQAFQRREVAKLAKEMVDITHECGKEAMMFLGDHWIGTEPFMEEFATIGLDAVVGSVGNGSTLRLISDIKAVSCLTSFQIHSMRMEIQ